MATAEPVLHVSRHFLGFQGTHMRLLPFSSTLADADGGQLQHRLAVVANWNQDAEGHRLSILDLQMRTGAPGELRPAVQELASWVQPSATTALEAEDLGGGECCIVAGAAAGYLSRLRLDIPLLPNALPSDIQVKGDSDFEGYSLLPWRRAHAGPAAALDILTDTREVLSAGQDGALAITPLDGAAQTAGVPFAPPRASVSYRAARWSFHHTFVTAGTSGGLEVWDRRVGPRPVRASQPGWGATGCGALDRDQGLARQINCLAVAPGRPHLCASGASGGCVALWDLRFGAGPAAACLAGPAGGEVIQVHFDPMELPGGSAPPHPALLFCTGGGALGYARPGEPSSSSSSEADNAWLPRPAPSAVAIYREAACGLAGCDVDAAAGQDVAAITDHEGLVLLRRRGP